MKQVLAPFLTIHQPEMNKIVCMKLQSSIQVAARVSANSIEELITQSIASVSRVCLSFSFALSITYHES